MLEWRDPEQAFRRACGRLHMPIYTHAPGSTDGRLALGKVQARLKAGGVSAVSVNDVLFIEWTYASNALTAILRNRRKAGVN